MQMHFWYWLLWGVVVVLDVVEELAGVVVEDDVEYLWF